MTKPAVQNYLDRIKANDRTLTIITLNGLNLRDEDIAELITELSAPKNREVVARIETLSFIHNNLEIGQDLSALVNLRALLITYNNLKTVPKVVSSLETLDLTNNNLETLNLAGLLGIKKIHLNDNNFTVATLLAIQAFKRFTTSTIDSLIIDTNQELNGATELTDEILTEHFSTILSAQSSTIINPAKAIEARNSMKDFQTIYDQNDNKYRRELELINTYDAMYLTPAIGEIEKMPKDQINLLQNAVRNDHKPQKNEEEEEEQLAPTGNKLNATKNGNLAACADQTIQKNLKLSTSTLEPQAVNASIQQTFYEKAVSATKLNLQSYLEKIKNNDHNLIAIDLADQNIADSDIEGLIAELSLPANQEAAKRIRSIALNGNKLTTMPKLSVLVNLDSLHLDNNQLVTIPNPASLGALKHLSISANPLTLATKIILRIFSSCNNSLHIKYNEFPQRSSLTVDILHNHFNPMLMVSRTKREEIRSRISQLPSIKNRPFTMAFILDGVHARDSMDSLQRLLLKEPEKLKEQLSILTAYNTEHITPYIRHIGNTANYYQMLLQGTEDMELVTQLNANPDYIPDILHVHDNDHTCKIVLLRAPLEYNRQLNNLLNDKIVEPINITISPGDAEKYEKLLDKIASPMTQHSSPANIKDHDHKLAESATKNDKLSSQSITGNMQEVAKTTKREDEVNGVLSGGEPKTIRFSSTSHPQNKDNVPEIINKQASHGSSPSLS